MSEPAATSLEARPAHYEVVEISGVKLPLDLQVISPQIEAAIRDGSYERGEAKFLPGMIEPGERLVEVGGGIGYLSALVGLQNKAEAIVVVEAHPDLLPLIEATHRMNDVQAEVLNGVVMNVKTAPTAPFYIMEDFWASSLIPPKRQEPKRVVDVPVIRFNRLVKTYRPTMMIIDVEGAEAQLLDGVSLAGVRKVLIELHHKVLGPVGLKKVFDIFSAHDFHYDPRVSNQGVVLFRRIERG